MGDKLGENASGPLGSKSWDQGYKVQLMSGYLWHPSGISCKPIVFNIHIKDTENRIECTLSKAVDGTNPGGRADGTGGQGCY